MEFWFRLALFAESHASLRLCEESYFRRGLSAAAPIGRPGLLQQNLPQAAVARLPSIKVFFERFAKDSRREIRLAIH
jgi:hypothetical protein